MISVVCVYNKEHILKEFLLKSLKHQTVNFELVTIDNSDNKFKSASQALNYGGKKATGKYIMFAHQDVDLCLYEWLEKTENLLDTIPKLGIAGVMGISDVGTNNKERGRNIIKHGWPPTVWAYGNPIEKPEPVQTLDECLIIIPKSVFNILKFDEKICDKWHLYAVDYCLSVKKLGFEVYAIPMFIYHRMGTVVLPDYYKVLIKVLRKHRDRFKCIYTSCGNWKTSYPLIRILPGFIKRCIRLFWLQLIGKFNLFRK